MNRLLALVALITLVSTGCSNETGPSTTVEPSQAGMFAESGSGSLAQSALATDPERQMRIKDNLIFQLGAQLQGQEVIVGEIEENVIEGFDGGLLRIGQQTLRFLTSKDDKNFFLVAAGPMDVSLTSAQREEAVLEAQRQAEEIATQRQIELSAAAESLPARGADNGSVSVVEFSDFQCPFCRGAATTVEQLMEKYPGEIRFSYMHFPLNIHPWAMPAAIIASCTSNLNHDVFWTLHDAYFANQDDITPENLLDKSRGFVSDTGIDMTAWTECVEDPASLSHLAAEAAVQQSVSMGNEYGLTGTPGFFINGKFLRGAPPIEQFSEIIEDALGK